MIERTCRSSGEVGGFQFLINFLSFSLSVCVHQGKVMPFNVAECYQCIGELSCGRVVSLLKLQLCYAYHFWAIGLLGWGQFSLF